MNNKMSYSTMFFGGIILIASCVVGACISSLNNLNEIVEVLYIYLLVPNVLGVIFIVVGMIGFKKK